MNFRKSKFFFENIVPVIFGILICKLIWILFPAMNSIDQRLLGSLFIFFIMIASFFVCFLFSKLKKKDPPK